MLCRSCNMFRVPLTRSYAAVSRTSTLPNPSVALQTPPTPTTPKPKIATQSKPRRKEMLLREPELAMTSRKLPTSLKKMDALANLIIHKPVSHAILQLKFSNKRHAPHLSSLLENARRGAIGKGMHEESLVVDQAWITKGRFVKRVWMKGRGRMAVQRRPRVGMDIRLRDRVTLDRRVVEKKEKKVRKMMKAGGSGLVQRPIYNSTMFSC